MDSSLATASTQTLKQINKSTVLSTIYFHGPISRSEIAEVSHLSLATVTNMVAELLKEKIILETGYQESRGGRRSALLEINPEGSFIVGMEVGETGITTLVTNIKLETKILKKTFLDEKENRPATIISVIVNSVQSALSEANVAVEKVLGIGIGIPGLVDRDKGVSIFAPNWGWHDIPIKKKIEEALKVATYVDNGANVMALGEKWFGAAQGANNLLVLILGTGLGAGVIVNGQICRGATESAGEWGHMIINTDGPKCSCGSRGCVEAYAGVTAIIRRTKEALAATSENSLLRKIAERQGITVREVIKAAKSGDPIATQVLKETGQYIGIGIANLVNLFNPEVIIIGGWVGIEAAEFLLPAIQSVVKKHALEFPLRSTRIAISRLADRAIAVGAATVVLHKFLRPPKIKNAVSW